MRITEPTPSQWLAKKYRYANGVVYNQNHYTVLFYDNGRYVGVGGALICANGRAIAYIGQPGDGGSVKRIMSHTRAFVWGNDLMSALKNLKATYPDPFKADWSTGGQRVR